MGRKVSSSTLVYSPTCLCQHSSFVLLVYLHAAATIFCFYFFLNFKIYNYSGIFRLILEIILPLHYISSSAVKLPFAAHILLLCLISTIHVLSLQPMLSSAFSFDPLSSIIYPRL